MASQHNFTSSGSFSSSMLYSYSYASSHLGTVPVPHHVPQTYYHHPPYVELRTAAGEAINVTAPNPLPQQMELLGVKFSRLNTHPAHVGCPVYVEVTEPQKQLPERRRGMALGKDDPLID